MPIYAVHYDYDPDRTADRDAHRPAHRDYLGGLEEQGTVLLRGPYPETDGNDPEGRGPGALLVLRADSPDAVAEALDLDPFHQQGLIIRRTIREWTPGGNHPF